jgi:L,D-transpeptidase catalytic domain
VRETPSSRAHRGLPQALRPVLLPVAAALVFILLLGSRESRSETASATTGSSPKDASFRGLPRPIKPAFVPGTPTFLRASAATARWAVVRTAVAARTRPSAEAPKVTRLETHTPEGTSNIVLVLGNGVDDAGVLWIRARLPVLSAPNTGWIPRSALGGSGTVNTHLVVDLHSLRATLFRSGRAIFRADVGVGKPSWPTPRGEFYVRNKLTRFASAMYGPVAFGTSARSSVLTDWPAGGYVGIHGTDRPDLLPGRVSHGCIRMRNPDILRIAKLMPVGTPITIR